VAASLDATGRPWASLLTGPAGFVRAIDERLLGIAVAPDAGKPLADNLAVRPELALLVFDPRTRQRMRFNGRGLSSDGVFLMTDQVYGNCPKYIQKRRLIGESPLPPGTPVRSKGLDARQRDLVTRADTLFIASFHPQGGADASHRGGQPGFVRVEGGHRVSIPDYPGNNMFNTLGNLVRYPRAGLLFVDFEQGGVLQMTGRATLDMAPERRVSLDVEEVWETRNGSPLRWELVEYSPSNPRPACHDRNGPGISTGKEDECPSTSNATTWSKAAASRPARRRSPS
jgi:uncharacterized protein